MARKPRIFVKNGVYHIVLYAGVSGNSPKKSTQAKSTQTKSTKAKTEQKLNLFRNQADRKAWEALVSEGVERFGHSILGFCCMKHQINLVIQVGETPLSMVMQNLSFRFTRHYNSRYGTTGSIFNGRYRAVLVDPEVHLDELIAHVHNEPVKDGLVKKAADYKWSSHQAYLGKATVDWLDTGTVLSRFGKTPKSQRSAFDKYVNSVAKQQPSVDFVRGSEGARIVGSSKFRKKAMKPSAKPKKKLSLSQVARHICKSEGVSESVLKGPSRARYESFIRQLIACVAVDLEAASLTEVAERYNRDLTTMSRNQRYFREQAESDSETMRQINAYKKALMA